MRTQEGRDEFVACFLTETRTGGKQNENGDSSLQLFGIWFCFCLRGGACLYPFGSRRRRNEDMMGCFFFHFFWPARDFILRGYYAFRVSVTVRGRGV